MGGEFRKGEKKGRKERERKVEKKGRERGGIKRNTRDKNLKGKGNGKRSEGEKWRGGKRGMRRERGMEKNMECWRRIGEEKEYREERECFRKGEGRKVGEKEVGKGVGKVVEGREGRVERREGTERVIANRE
jgi:hypothetical protein